MSNYQLVLHAIESRQKAQLVNGRKNISSSKVLTSEDSNLHDALNRLHSDELLTLFSQLFIGRGDNNCHVCARTNAMALVKSKIKGQLINDLMGQLNLYEYLKQGEDLMRSRSCSFGCPLCEPNRSRYQQQYYEEGIYEPDLNDY